MAADKKHYIDRDKLHEELVFCKRKNEGVLTRKAIDYFFKLAKNLIRQYKGLSDDDINDCVASSVQDMYKYWHNFKEANVVRLPVIRNFQEGEGFIIDIKGHGKLKFIAKAIPDPKKNEFLIGHTANASMSLFKTAATKYENLIKISIDKIKGNLTMMDTFNYETMERKSVLTIIHVGESSFLSIPDKEITFCEPPNAFSYLTSVARSGILKGLGKLKSAQQKKGNVISLNGINESNNGLYSL